MIKVTAFGRTQSLAAWTGEFGIPGRTITSRIAAGHSPEVAVKSKVRVTEVITVSMTISEWAAATEINEDTIRDRLRRGWSERKAVTKPAGKRRK